MRAVGCLPFNIFSIFLITIFKANGLILSGGGGGEQFFRGKGEG